MSERHRLRGLTVSRLRLIKTVLHGVLMSASGFGWVLAAALVVCAAPIYAQSGGIAGAVTGPAGAIAGARIEVTGATLAVPRVTVSDPLGRYAVQGLPAGRYHVTFSAPGFESQVLEDVTVADGFTRVVSMRMGAAASTLESRLAPLTGPDAIDCGEFGAGATEIELRAALKCGLDAVGRGRTFRLVKYQTHRADGMTMSHGLLGITGGALVTYQYWSASCGSGACEDKFVTRPCLSPRIQGEAPRRRPTGDTGQSRDSAAVVLQSLGAHVACD